MDKFVGSAFGDQSAPYYDAALRAHEAIEPIADFLLASLYSAGTLIEIGVGTGRVAAVLAERSSGHIVGADISPKMLDILRARGVENLDALELDITSTRPSGVFDGAYCIYNTLFMLGPIERQDQALNNIRASVQGGGSLVVEVFQPRDDFYAEDSLYMEPQYLDDSSVHLAVSKVNAAARVVEMQNVFLTNEGITLAPSSFHFRTVDEIDTAAERAGWSLEERFARWDRSPFTERSMNSISVFRAT